MSEDWEGPEEGPQDGGSSPSSSEPPTDASPGSTPRGAAAEEASSDEEGALVKTAELLSKTGISRQVLYRYMQLDLVVPAKTTESGRNYFSPRVFMILDLIERLKSRGYTLRDIKDIVGEKMASAQRDDEEAADAGD